MSIPASKQRGSVRRKSGGADEHALASTDSLEVGAKAPRVPQTSRRVEEAGSSVPQPGAFDVFGLLQRAVEELTLKGRMSKAAAVSLQMRRLDPDFSLEMSGYGTFRLLLEAAEAEGYVGLERVDSDLLVRLRTSTGAAKIDRLSNDLWSAFIRWGDQAFHFDRATGRTQPGPVSDVRREVAVRRVTEAEQVGWMRAFVDGLNDEEASARLSEGLDEADSARGFLRAARANPRVAAKWKRYLRQQVLATAAQWAAENKIPIADLDNRSQADPSLTPAPGRAASRDDQMKAEIITILQSMPLGELLRLPIPVEYALRR